MKKKHICIIFSILLTTQIVFAQKIKVSEVFGIAEVLLLSQDNTVWQKCEKGMILSIKDKLRTGRNSFVKVLFEGDKFIIKERTIVQLKKLSTTPGEKTIIRLIRGTLRGILRFITQRGGEVQIFSPTAIVDIRGTDFVIDASMGKRAPNKVYVFEGKVEVANIKQPEITVTVPAYKMTEVPVNSSPTVPQEIPSEILTEYNIPPKPAEVESIEPVPAVTPAVKEEPTPKPIVQPAPVEEPKKTVAPAEKKEKQPIAQPKPKPKPKPAPPKKEEKKEPWCPDPQLEFHFGLDFQYLNINNKGYGLIAIMPEFAICKIGVGFYLPIIILSYKHFLYSKKWYNHNEWDFKSPSDSLHDFVIKFMYVRYGQKGDPLYIRIGGLPSVTFGNGFIMNGYSNMIDFPTIRRIGLEFGYIYGNFIGIEAMCADLGRRQIYGARLLAFPFRLSQIALLSKFQIGATLVTDTKPINDKTKVINWGFDAGMPIITAPLLSMRYFLDWATYSVYAPEYLGKDEWVASDNFGFATGFKGKLVFFVYRAEYRYLQDNYIPEYFDYFYEIQREKKFRSLIGMYLTSSPDTVNGYLVKMGACLGGAGEIGFVFQEYYNDEISNKATVYLTLAKGVIPYGYGTVSYNKVNVVGLTGNRSLFGNLYDENTILTFDGGIKIMPFVYLKIYYQRTYEYDETGKLINKETYSTGMSIGF